jgi:tetratricopeptide (TPR) repeat protein
VLRLQKRDADAVAAARKAVELNPTNWNHRMVLSEALGAAGLLDEAETQTQKAVELAPVSAEVWTALAGHHYQRKTWEECLTAARKAISIDPKQALAHERAGNALWQLRRWKEAVAAYRVARDLGADTLSVNRSLASAMRTAGEPAEARLPVVRRWVELDPKNAAAHSHLGGAFLNLGRWGEAAAALRTAIDLDPKQALAHFNLGESLRQLGDWQGAVVAYRAATELSPQVAEWSNKLGVALLDGLGDGPAAAAAFRTAATTPPTNSTYHGNLASALIRMRNYDGATVAARIAIEANPRSPNGYLALAAALAHGGRPAEGYKVLADALREYPAWLRATGNPSRYNLACAAVLVGTGYAKDFLPPPDTVEMRHRALDWLRSYFVDVKKNFAADPTRNRGSTHRLMNFWTNDADLVGVRDPKLLEKLPTEERAAWELFWHDVALLREVSYSPTSAPGPREADPKRP